MNAGEEEHRRYVCDRFIIPGLTPAQQSDIGRGHLLQRDIAGGSVSVRSVVTVTDLTGTTLALTETPCRARVCRRGEPATPRSPSRQ